MIVDGDAFSNQTFEVTKAQESIISEAEAADSGPRKPKTSGVLSTPAVRNFAKQLGVDIEDVHGTGKDERVLKEDILNYAAREGILKHSSASSDSSSTDLDGDLNSPEISSTYVQEYEDRTVALR